MENLKKKQSCFLKIYIKVKSDNKEVIIFQNMSYLNKYTKEKVAFCRNNLINPRVWIKY